MARTKNVSALDKAAQQVQALKSEHAELVKQREQISKRIDEIEAAASGFGGASGRRGSRKTGRKVTAKTGNGETKQRRIRGVKPEDVLVQHVLPTREEAGKMDTGGINKGQMVESARKHSWDTASENPEILIGQALSKLKKSRFASTGTRGHWHLTSMGEQARERAANEAEKQEAESAKETAAA